jgi:biopolymer transport protein ExbB/TolQ
MNTKNQVTELAKTMKGMRGGIIAHLQPKTVLGQKLKLFFLMFIQWLGYAAFTKINFWGTGSLAIALGGGLMLTIAYMALAFFIYLNNNFAKRILTYINLILVLFALYFPIFPKLAAGVPFRAPEMLGIDERLVRATHIFNLKNLWPGLIIIFCAGLILNMLRRHTLLKLWDRSAAGRREHADTRISLGNSLVLGIFLWLLFYCFLISLPSGSQFVRDFQHLFLGDHIIYYLLLLVFWWAVTLIVCEYLSLRRETKIFHQVQRTFQIVSFGQIGQSEALTLLTRLEQGFNPISSSTVVYRVHNLLKVILEGKSQLLEENFQRTDDIEFQAVENARGFIGTLVWSLPMIGFMGTIMGIIKTVGKFTHVIGGEGKTVELTESLKGLSLAFETTLIGLITALAAGYILSLVRRFNDGLNVSLSQFCHEEIISKADVKTGETKIIGEKDAQEKTGPSISRG